jgi:hypothetical protein
MEYWSVGGYANDCTGCSWGSSGRLAKNATRDVKGGSQELEYRIQESPNSELEPRTRSGRARRTPNGDAKAEFRS